MIDGSGQLAGGIWAGAEAGFLKGGRAADEARAFDWSATSLGSPGSWPPAMHVVVGMVLSNGFPSMLALGPDLLCIHNDACRALLGERPQATGRPFFEVWPELVEPLAPLFERALAGETVLLGERPFTLTRNGRAERARLTASISPVRGEGGTVAGLWIVAVEAAIPAVAEASRGQDEAGRTFLLALGDRVRPMGDPAAVIAATTRALGEHLGATRVTYAEIDEAADRATARGDWTDGRAVHLPEEIRLSDFGAPLIGRLRTGGTLRVDDVRHDEHTRESLPALEGIGARAVVSVPLFKDGRLVVNLNVHQDRPRAWTDAEVGLIETVAERTWEAVERVRVETALRVSEAELQTLTDTLPVLIAYVDAERRYRFINRGYEDWFPRRREEILDRPVAEVIGEAAYATVAPYIDRVLAGERLTFGQFMPCLSMGHRHVEVEYVPRFAPSGRVQGFYALVQDVSARRAAEEALRESEARFRTMADNAPVMMWVTDPTGFCTYLNARWYEFTGQPPGAGEGFGWLDAVHPEDRPAAEAAFVSANAERRGYRTDFRLRQADGRYRWALDAAAARTTPQGEFLGYVGSVIDIDERREAEARLALSEEQLRLATEAAEIGLWDVDVIHDTLFWPPRVKAMFGISAEVPVSMADFYAGLHPDDAHHTALSFAAACDPAARALYDVEYRTIGKEDGVLRWVAAKGRGVFDEGGRCIRVIGTAIDITGRKAVEARLRELNETLEQRVAERTAERNRVWAMSRDLLAIMGFDGYLKAINPAWEATLGYDTATLLATPFPEQVHPEDHPAVRAAVERLRRGETIARFEDRLRHADGSWRWIAWGLVPEGDVFYAVGRDVTAEKAAAEELERTQDALRQAQKMEAVGQLTGGIAHDFNNLLGAVVGSLDLIRRRADDIERVRRYAEAGLQAAERGAKLTGQLLAFSRAQRLELKALFVPELIRGMEDMLARALGPMVRLHLRFDGERLPVLSDPTQLEMAVLNLAINARDAMPGGGDLTIGTALRHLREDPELSAGDYVELSVTDTGSGMAPEVLARAFDPFFTTKGIGKGTGLGLSQVYGIARQAGGTVRIESAPGQGTTVRLFLRRTDTAVATGGEAEAGVDGRTAAAATVLLVDDDPDMRRMLAESLDILGYRVIEAQDGPSGLAALEAGAPDLMIVDYAMPGMNGAEVARAARERRPDLPIVFASGYADTAAIERVAGPEATVLRKPFRVDHLQAVLASAMAAAGGR